MVDDNVNSAIDAGNSYSSNGHYSGGYNGQNHGNNPYGYNTGPVSINLYTDTSNAITEWEIITNGTLMNQTIHYRNPSTEWFGILFWIFFFFEILLYFLIITYCN